ncbi:MAG: CvpA family protein [Alistipes sp.]|nr:CvpA family protein [Alistipes sp.]
MIIDILVLICAIWAFVIGLRRGLIVQLCHFVGLYAAILFAPNFALEVGSYMFDDAGKAYIAGFALIVVAAILLVWIVAPLLRFVIVWRPIRPIDALLGGILNLATMVVVTAALFAVFDSVNLGSEIRQDRLIELMEEYEGREAEMRERIASLEAAEVDEQMRQYLHHRYIDYETLCESRCFFPLSKLGTRLVPSLQQLNEQISSRCDEIFGRIIEQKLNDNNINNIAGNGATES